VKLWTVVSWQVHEIKFWDWATHHLSAVGLVIVRAAEAPPTDAATMAAAENSLVMKTILFRTNT
jgi:hypothetical protein